MGFSLFLLKLNGGFIMGLTKSIIFIFLLAAVTSSSGQVIGKIFSSEYADLNFGNVISYKEIDNVELRDMLQKAGTYIMFNIDTKKQNNRSWNGSFRE